MLRKLLFIGLFIVSLSCSSGSIENEVLQVYDYKYSADETALLQLINDYRIAKNLKPLTIINHISYLSLQHNQYMIKTNTVNHDAFVQRSEELMKLFNANNVSENVAYNYVTNEGVLNAWLNSPSHKKNIEGNFTDFGLSITEDSLTKKKYYTNIFIKIFK